MVGGVVAHRLLFLAAGWLGYWLTVEAPVRPNFSLEIWKQWDAIHFLNIAERGYDDSIASGNAAAFFPGFPLAVRFLNSTGIDLMASSLLVSLIGTVVASVYLYRLAEADGHDGSRSVLALLLFPTAVFLVAPYSEALFLAGAIPAFFYARHGDTRKAVPFVLVAALTRTVGVLIGFGVAIEMVRRAPSQARTWLGAAGLAATGFLPMVAYGFHLQRTKGDFLEFVHAQERGWLRRLTNPADSLLATWGSWFSDRDANLRITDRIEIVFAVLAVGLLYWLIRREQWGYAVFVGGTLALALASPLYMSIPRFCLTFFPLMFLIADATRKRRHERLVLPALAGASTIGVFLFVNDRWFF